MGWWGFAKCEQFLHSARSNTRPRPPSPTSDRGWGLTAPTEVFPVMFDFLEELHKAGRLKKNPLEPEDQGALCIQSDHTFDIEWLRYAG